MNEFKKLSNSVCKSCRADCCKEFEVFLSEYDKMRIMKINKDRDLFDGNSFNTKNNACPFYDDKKKKCTIHNNKPLDCRIYPYSFWFERGRIELWLDLKCDLSKHLTTDKKFYNEAMMIAKNELVYWSEGEIFAYLISGFDIEKFKRQVRGKKKHNYYKYSRFDTSHR